MVSFNGKLAPEITAIIAQAGDASGAEAAAERGSEEVSEAVGYEPSPKKRRTTLPDGGGGPPASTIAWQITDPAATQQVVLFLKQ